MIPPAGQRQALAQRVRAIPLQRVLPWCGAQPDRADRRKWHTPAGVLSVTGAKFMNWNLGVGGGGAIALVIHLRHLDFKGAVDWLADHFPAALSTLRSTATEDGLPEPVAPSPVRPLQLPPRAPGRLAPVGGYLMEQRRLPRALLEPLLAADTLYADARANAVFLLRDGHHLPVGAELRGTTGVPWRGLGPGSRKDRAVRLRCRCGRDQAAHPYHRRPPVVPARTKRELALPHSKRFATSQAGRLRDAHSFVPASRTWR